MPKKLRLVTIRKSHRKDKKLDAVFANKVVPFGQKGYSDFTKHKNKTRRARYLKRHSGMGEHWNRPDTPGALSRWILWNKPSLKASIADYKKRFQLGGDDVEGVLKRRRMIHFTATPDEEMLKIANDMNADNEFANKYGATYDDRMIVIKDGNDVGVAWIYNADARRAYMQLDPEVAEIPDELAKDMASVYRRFLKR